MGSVSLWSAPGGFRGALNGAHLFLPDWCHGGEPPPDYDSIINPYIVGLKAKSSCFIQLYRIFKGMFVHASLTLCFFSICNNLGFLQKNNNLDEKSRIVSSLNEPPSPQKLGLQDPRFRHTETDFSNLYARGEKVHLLSPAFLKVHFKCIGNYILPVYFCVYPLSVSFDTFFFYLHTDNRILLLP